jgi:hypothetical protein
MNDRTRIVRDTMMFCWNVSWHQFCLEIFSVDLNTAPNHKIMYLEKYKVAWSENPASLFALLDYDNMNKITNAAKAKYGEVKGI